MIYEIEMRDDGGGQCAIFVESTPATLESDAQCECQEWAEEGEWGDAGASIPMGWTAYQNGVKVASGSYEAEIEPNHDALIREAGGYPECEHDWTAKGEGGCKENPGVWSMGGTSISYSTHCQHCGLHRNEITTGSQRNPGEHDTVEYSQPDSWCGDCEAEECHCTE